MKKRLNLLFALIGTIAFCGWINHSENPIKKAKWLIGTWENQTQRGSIYETWAKVSDDELLGKSYILKENDTIVFETISLIQANDSLFYIPTVKNQNEGLPVRFSAKLIEENRLVFENPKHDFPQAISYAKISADSLKAEISGIKNGQERKMTFPMKRVE